MRFIVSKYFPLFSERQKSIILIYYRQQNSMQTFASNATQDKIPNSFIKVFMPISKTLAYYDSNIDFWMVRMLHIVLLRDFKLERHVF